MNGVIHKDGWADWYRGGKSALSIFTNGSDDSAWVRGNLNAPLKLTSSYAGCEVDFDNHCRVYDGGTVTCLAPKNGKVYIKNYGSTGSFGVIGAAGYDTASSIRVKENIKKLSDDDAFKLLELNPVFFDYIEEVGGMKDNVGLIAEEVLGIIPKVVNIPDNYSEDSTDIENILTINYSEIIPYLIKMIQIQQKDIESLKAE